MTSPAVVAKPPSVRRAQAAKVELAIIATVAVAAGIAEYAIDGLRRATVSLVEREDLLVAELTALLLVTVTGLAIYSWRRYREHVRTEQLNLSLRASVTQAEVLNQRYRSYADAVVRGQENERLRLGRELHDDTIHRLILLGQKVELARLDLEHAPNTPDLQEIQQLTNTTIDHIRRFIQDLRPTFLDELGLVPALEALTAEKTDRTGIEISLVTTGHPSRIGENEELTLYRIAQTALRNVALHSQASEAEVRLDFTQTLVTLTIEDNGIGFDLPKNLDQGLDGHFGLLSMQERAQLAGGKFHIQSAARSGTTIHAEIPHLTAIEAKTH